MKFSIYTIVILIYSFILFTNSYAEEIVIIANRAYPSNSISLATLKEIYLAEKITEKGVRIKPYDQKSSRIRKKFVTKILGVGEDAYNAYWIKKVFQEGGVPPLTKSASDDVIRAVGDEVGGIGYVWKQESHASNIKIILTIEAGD